MTSTALFVLLFLLVFIGLWLLHGARYPTRPAVILRRLPAYELMRGATAAAAEDGRPLHLSLGTGGIAAPGALQTVAALSALEYLSQQASVSTNAPLVSTADPTALLLAQDVAAAPFAATGRLAQFDPTSVRFIGGSGPQAVSAYAAGLFDLFDRKAVSASFLLGSFGDESVLLGESAARNGIPQVAGSGNPVALAMMALTADHLLVGEELFAAGAYLSRRRWEVAALLAQDSVRWLIIAFVVVAAVLKTFGLF